MPKPKFQAPHGGFLQNADRRATQPLSIEMIPIEQLRDNPANFFSIEDIDELANDIRENGLLHYPVVRPDPDGSGAYVILSGHRRRHAYELLRQEDASRYSVMPCQVREVIDDAEAEIILLSANMQSREVSPREKRQAASRLYRLAVARRAEGSLPIEGRTKDYVAQQLKLSGKSVMQLVRINECLIPELLDLFDRRELPVNVAYAAAALSAEKQGELYAFLKDASPMNEPEIQALLRVVSATGLGSLAGTTEAEGGEESANEARPDRTVQGGEESPIEMPIQDIAGELEALTFRRAAEPTDEELAGRVRALEKQLTRVQEASQEKKREALLRVRCDAYQAQLERLSRDILKLAAQVEPEMLAGVAKAAGRLVKELNADVIDSEN